MVFSLLFGALWPLGRFDIRVRLRCDVHLARHRALMGAHAMNNDIVPFTVGIILILGAFFRWRWLVDPPLEWAPMYSQALLKLIVGTRGVVWFTYFLGLLF